MRLTLAIASFLAAGCAALPGGEFADRRVPIFGAFTSAPRSGPVSVWVMLAPEERILEQCWRANHYRLGMTPPACVEPSGIPGRPPTIWITAPRNWEDPYICALGHEVLHELGANHR